MSQPYVGQIMLFGGNFAPAGWMFCKGDIIPIAEYETLFALIGTTYGGDGQSTFGLPDLRGRAPVHVGAGNGLSNYVLGEPFGTESVTLSTQQMAAHQHFAKINTSAANSAAPANHILANEVLGLGQATSYSYGPFGGTQSALAAVTIGPAGSNAPHENRQPYLVINYIISLYGVFPPQN